MNIESLLKYMNKYIDLTCQEIDVLAKYIKFRKYLKGQYIVQQGEICKYDSFILKGCSRTFHVDNKGQEHTVIFAIENWWTGDLGSFMTQASANYNVQCLENMELIQFSYENLEQLYLEIPKMERFFRLILQEAYAASEKRIIRNFSLPAKERYIIFRERHPQIEQRVPQYMIASYLGITKEFLSKIRSQIISEQ